MKPSSEPHAYLVLFLITQDWSVYSHRIDLIKDTLKAGYRVAVMCHFGDYAQALEREGVEVYPWKSIARGRLNIFREFFSFMEVFTVYRKLRPDLVYQVSLKPVLYGSFAAKILGLTKIVNLLGGLGYLFMHQSFFVLCLRKLVLWALRFVLCGKNTYLVLQNKDDWADLDKSLVTARTVLIPGSGVNTDKFKVGARDHKPPRIIMVARLLKDKGLMDYLEASLLLKKQGVQAEFFCAGTKDPANPTSLTDIEIEKWEQEKVITFLGAQKDMPELLSHMDIGVLPSYREGLPKALLECGAAGLPLVSTDVPGCRDVVDSGKTGFLVPPKNPKALAQALAILIKDEKMRTQMGDESRKRTETIFSQKIINTAFLDLFKKILS